MGPAPAAAGALLRDGDGPGELTVGRLAATFGLSRSTLLYYDRIGVLRPSARSSAGYRRYGPADVARLDAVCRLRRAGLPLEAIGRLLDAPGPELVAALALKLVELDGQVQELRAQQLRILDALSSGEAAGVSWTPDRAELVGLLEEAGLGEREREAWHAAAERAGGPAHQALLEALGLSPDEIAALRRWRGDSAGATVEA